MQYINGPSSAIPQRQPSGDDRSGGCSDAPTTWCQSHAAPPPGHTRTHTHTHTRTHTHTQRHTELINQSGTHTHTRHAHTRERRARLVLPPARAWTQQPCVLALTAGGHAGRRRVARACHATHDRLRRSSVPVWEGTCVWGGRVRGP